MDDAGERQDDPTLFTCPHCGQPLELDAPSQDGWITCPSCGQQFVVPSTRDSDEDSPDEQQETPSHEAELDGLRIRNLSVARRAAIRSRSYAIIAAGVCAVAVGQLAVMTFRHFHDHTAGIIKPIGYVLCAIASVMGMIYFLQRARELKHEIDHSAQKEPAAPPDFSTLSDGSQQWKNLEEMK